MSFNDTFITVFTSNISSHPHSCPINPLQRQAHNLFVVCVCEIQDFLLFILLTRAQRRQLLLQQLIIRLWLWHCSILFTGRLLHLTFIVAPGGREHANAIEAFNAKGLVSRRHHKSIHAKINHFHWTPSMRKEESEGGG